MKLIDTHAHLDFEQFDEDREAVIAAAREKLHAVVVPGLDHENAKRVLDLSAQHNDFLFPALGLHPTAVPDATEEGVQSLCTLIREEKGQLVAVGEIGMDFHHARKEKARTQQRDAFERFLALAEELQFPVIIHSRDAEKHCLNTLEQFDVTGVMHAFNGTVGQAERAIDSGFLIGVSTQVLYSSRVQELVRALELDHVVLETDAPFLYRSDRNIPTHVHASAKKIADLKDHDLDTVATVTNKNAAHAFENLAWAIGEQHV